MNRLRDPHTPVFVGEHPPDADAMNPTQLPGTREAGPRVLRPVGYAPTSTEESLSRRSLKGEAGWGSRLGCRAGG